jgi:hypothetical protein
MFLGLTNIEYMREVTINMLVCTFHLLGGKIGRFVKPSQSLELNGELVEVTIVFLFYHFIL